MTITEIRKHLYKQRPEAKLISVNKTGIKYVTTIKVNDIVKELIFLIPHSDIGDATLNNVETSSYLSRWIVI